MAEGRDVTVDLRGLRELRLRVQGLRSPFDASAPEVVRRFVAVQAQEFLPAQWGLAARVPFERRPDAASVAAALDAGEILRTHVLRPTWHFLHPEDARWVMELSAERVHRANGTYYRRTTSGALASNGDRSPCTRSRSSRNPWRSTATSRPSATWWRRR